MATTNGQYAAYTRHGKVYVEELTRSEVGREPRCLPLPHNSEHVVLALSRLRPNILAVSSASHTLVYDILEGQLQGTISGNGRAITALDWSAAQANLLWTGTIDGGLSLWDMERPVAPIVQAWVDGAFQAIECCSTDPSVVAAINKGKVTVFKQVSRMHLRTVKIIRLEGDEAISLSWLPSDSGRLVVGSKNGQLYRYDLSTVLDAVTDRDGGLESDSSDGEDAFFGDPDGIHTSGAQNLEIPPQEGLVQVGWLSKNAFLCLGDHGMRVSFWLWQQSAQEAIELWTQDLAQKAISVSLARQGERACMILMTLHGAHEATIPEDVQSTISLKSIGSRKIPASSAELGQSPSTSSEAKRICGMRPIAIPELRSTRGSFPKTSKQLRSRKPSFERRRDKAGRSESMANASAQNQQSPPPLMSMTSSLELPKPRGEEGSPMPFLSPSIPSQQPSPGDLSQLDDTIELPPLPRASFDSSVQSASAATEESDDSDDETFVDGMQGSASFLPGGINVPLPKACAALFAPTGELLTFFPPKPKVASRKGGTEEGRRADPKASAKKVAKLFPSFGNLVGEPQHLLHDDDEDDSDFESSSTISGDPASLRLQPSFTFYPSSFPSQQSWKDRISPTKHSFTEQSPHKVIVSLHDVGDVGAVLPASRKLASEYRILCEQTETGTDLCLHNAEIAGAVGLENIAGIWRLMALLLDGQVPLEVLTGGRLGQDILVIARAATGLVKNDLQRLASNSQRRRTSGKLRWINNPLGALWTVRAVFDWAESQADIQLLAILSAILAEVQDQLPQNNVLFDQSLTSQLPLYQEDYFANDGALVRPRRFTNQSIPILRTDSIGTSNAVYESPVKLQRTSTASSLNPSNPSTPYLESNSSTPPFSVPALERQSTRLSISGSASPEHHRNSFSAAAKYYAQSISDKFASYGAYGASPPGRKTGISPSNTNELSTSFPSGSWGKSVSFASTANTTKTSFLSTSYEDVQEDEGYDSDKTVEDTSQPQTPRDSGDCVVMLKNDRLFDDDISGGSRARLLPDDLVEKGRLWCQYYAEQLRCWDLLIEAAELEKVCGMTCLQVPLEERTDGDDIGVEPAIAPHASRSCAICSVKTTGAQFFCPGCSHSAHLSCLEDFTRALCVSDEQQPFECPTGCGCRCDDLPFGVIDLAEVEPVKEAIEKPKKKASFTDPRRWRARVEGDSW